MKIYDNFLPDEIFQKLFSYIKGYDFKWNMTKVVDDTTDNRINNRQLAHVFYERHFLSMDTLELLFPFFQKIQPVALIKIKANLQLKTDFPSSSKTHLDHTFPNAMTAIYYVNSNDGYTMVGDQKVESVKGRAVIFPSSTIHFGTSSTQDRCVINFNYFPQK